MGGLPRRSPEGTARDGCPLTGGTRPRRGAAGRSAAVRRGRLAETRAEAWFVAQGLGVLGRRVRCADGELDLILLDGEGRVVFVEVRQRREGARVAAVESLTKNKLGRLRRAALTWLQAHPEHRERDCRCDVLLIGGGRVGSAAIEWLQAVW